MVEELNQRHWHIVDCTVSCVEQEEIFGPVLLFMKVLLFNLSLCPSVFVCVCVCVYPFRSSLRLFASEFYDDLMV